ncbi:hypothetical protein K6119_00765 [Paracrocinitomix mangrovi]|uniref:hypothetical protein n=1 Tax=Paracrocinitomix mangrovi TaxID=2862509 RepID=UPI001C8D9E88|nr:hypothetical protein [Paracrocinitomix mangrovi]UKN02045.1 hypothetical protein K6119_00765 [Paracrocinitomix mangrovi]
MKIFKVLIIVLTLFVFSCNKESVDAEAPSLIGIWQHNISLTESEVITINQDGTGKVEWYDNNSLRDHTKVKTWYVKDNRLTLGTITFSMQPYDIDEYPKNGSSTIIEGYDTIHTGQRYIKLNATVYTENL